MQVGYWLVTGQVNFIIPTSYIPLNSGLASIIFNLTSPPGTQQTHVAGFVNYDYNMAVQNSYATISQIVYLPRVSNSQFFSIFTGDYHAGNVTYNIVMDCQFCFLGGQ